MALFLRRPKSFIIILPLILVTIFFLHLIVQNQYQIRNLLSYATRPLWDVSDGPKNILPHYYAEGLKMDKHTCQLHGWNERPSQDDVRVLDAILMSSELDLLEVRMSELDPVIDFFLIVESNATFTGLQKKTYFADHRARFARFDHKIVYQYLPGYPLIPGQSAWEVEALTRDTMSALLRKHIQTLSQNSKPLVLMSDVDEIPSHHTVQLLKSCDFGQSIHLQLRNFLYSFEWYLGPSSWRASAHMWIKDSFYRHSKSADIILADAGWHCSYCFRTLSEYVVKMKGFSHSDRIGGRIDLLDPKRIQDTICRGKDIFGMLPEAYSYIDLFSQLSLHPETSAVGLPRFLIENSEKLRFLLPGGCIREK